jgi:hypothetical protein
MLSSRNKQGLTEREIARCEQIWVLLDGNGCCGMVTSEAHLSGSRTRFSQTVNLVYLGADALPSSGVHARSRMSEVACLAHELAHAQRFRMGIDRPVEQPAVFLDEAEASLHASFMQRIGFLDRRDLVEDARFQIAEWQKADEDQEEANKS